MIEVIIKLSWLLYDIENETYLKSRVLSDDVDSKKLAGLRATDDDESKEKMLRSIKTGLSEIKNELGEYIKEERDLSDNIHLNEEEDIKISLQMPSNYNNNVSQGIGEFIHTILVNKALGDWYNATMREVASDYYIKAKDGISGLRESISKRKRPKRSKK